MSFSVFELPAVKVRVMAASREIARRRAGGERPKKVHRERVAISCRGGELRDMSLKSFVLLRDHFPLKLWVSIMESRMDNTSLSFF
nr:hypothetical protein Itr_chr01CG01830 [Ipomoea trifida]